MRGEVYSPSHYLVLQAAQLYYQNDLSQKDIAKQLNVSAATVSRLLRRAKQERLITCVIPPECDHALQLAESLRKQFGLKEVIVVPPMFAHAPVADGEAMKRAVALEAARYLQRTIRVKDVLGVAWGGTMYHLIQYLNPCQRTEAPFLTLHGSLSCCNYEMDVHTLVTRMAMAFGGTSYSLYHDGRIRPDEDTASLMQNQAVHNVFRLFERITIAVAGIGAFYPVVSSPLASIEYLHTEELAELQAHGVVADFLIRFLDQNGNEIQSSIRDRTLSIPLDYYRRIPTRIVAASGAHKAYALRAVLLGDLVDVLIVDSALADSVCRLG